ncbi:MAG: hypothetical protein ACFB10_03165 [Salibacteraceae bacterium]
MHTPFKHQLLVGVLLLLWLSGFSQSNAPQPYSVLRRAQVEEKGLLKLGLDGLGSSTSSTQFESKTRLNYSLGLIYEFKIDTAWSLYAGFSMGRQGAFVRYSQYSSLLGVRYYPRMKSNVRNGRQANNLHGGYLATQLNYVLWNPRLGADFFGEQRRFFDISMLAGKQVHLGRRWFVDINFGIMASRTTAIGSLIYRGFELQPTGNFGLGFRW